MNGCKLLLPTLFGGAMVLAIGCVSPRELSYREVQVIEQQAHIDYLKRELANQEPVVRETVKVVEKPSIDPAFADDLGKYGAGVKIRNGELVIDIPSDILFRPGSNNLSAKDKSTLKSIVGLINNRYPTNFLRVEGHTDSDPIVRHKDKWNNNWHLSGGRSRAVLEYMIEECDIDPKRIYFAGFSKYRPVASNTSRAGKQKNRRVEIVVIPKRQ